jgi:ATP-dependent Clp protease adapter protein ClpS
MPIVGSTVVEPRLSEHTDLAPRWKVVLFNDDVTPFDVVIAGLQKAAGVSEEVAEMIALEAHETDAAVVRNGLTQTEADRMCLRLKQYTRIPRLCPGVGCKAEQDG